MISTKHKWLCDIFSFSLFFWGSRFKTNASRIGFEIIPFLTVLLVKLKTRKKLPRRKKPPTSRLNKKPTLKV